MRSAAYGVDVMENYFTNMNTRVLSEPILLLLLFLIHQLEKLSIYLMDEEDLSKYLKESVDLMRIIFPPPYFILI